MSTKAPPDFRAFSVIEREGKKSVWIPLGAAFLHRDGAGLNLLLQANPLDGKVVLRPFVNEGRKETAAEPVRS
jgi:hypothetical protein